MIQKEAVDATLEDHHLHKIVVLERRAAFVAEDVSRLMVASNGVSLRRARLPRSGPKREHRIGEHKLSICRIVGLSDKCSDVRASGPPPKRWSYHPAPGDTVAWVTVDTGTLRAPGPVGSGDLAIFEPSEESLDFLADGDTRFVLGSAKRHPHDLALGNYSVHTSEDALLVGEAEIRRIGQRLLADGTLQPLT